ncbi:MAG: hypothetical protein Q4B32_06695 [Clostridia bacterium]|nr:hypothetical protein [Clostridia bacterium]
MNYRQGLAALSALFLTLSPVGTLAEATGTSLTEASSVTAEEAEARAQSYMDTFSEVGLATAQVQQIPEGYCVYSNTLHVSLLIGSNGQLLRYVNGSMSIRSQWEDTEETADSVLHGKIASLMNVIGTLSGTSGKIDGDIRITRRQQISESYAWEQCEFLMDGESCTMIYRISTSEKTSDRTIELACFNRGDASSAMTYDKAWQAVTEAIDTRFEQDYNVYATFGYPDITLQWDGDANLWQAKVYIAYELQPENVQQKLTEAFGDHVLYNLIATVDGSTGQVSDFTDTAAVTEDVPENAQTGWTYRYTETAVLVNGSLRRAETLAPGTCYTVIRHGEESDSSDLYDEQLGWNRYILIRYTSPRTGEIMEGWIQDPSLNEVRFGDEGLLDKNLLRNPDVMLTYTGTDGKTIQYPMVFSGAMPEEGDPYADTVAYGVATPQLTDMFTRAVNALTEQYGFPAEVLLSYKGVYEYLNDAEDFSQPEWTITLYVTGIDYYQLTFTGADAVMTVTDNPVPGNG